MTYQNPTTKKENEMFTMEIPQRVIEKLHPHFNQVRGGTYYKPTFRAKSNHSALMVVVHDWCPTNGNWVVEVNREMQVVICEVLMAEVNNNKGDK